MTPFIFAPQPKTSSYYTSEMAERATWIRRLHHVCVYLDGSATLTPALRFVTMPRQDAPGAIVVHTDCDCLSASRLVQRVCVFAAEELVDCAYSTIECGGAPVRGPRTFTCENAWVSARAMHGLMLRQETCHTHPVCAQLDAARPCTLSFRQFVHEDGLAPVCTHCVRLTDAEMDARSNVLLSLPYVQLAHSRKRVRVNV